MILFRYWTRLANGGLAELHRVNSIAILGSTVRAEVWSYGDERNMLRLGNAELTIPFSALLTIEAGGDPVKAATLWLVSPDGPFPGGALLEPDPVEDTRAKMLAELERQRAAANAKVDQLASEIAVATAEQLPTIVVSDKPNSTAGATDV
jgi:hypothetical protein